MITKSSIKRNEKYYEALGHSPQGILSPTDFYRFKLVRRHIYGKSVLDVGCARGNFLRSIKPDYQIAGIEVTKQRIKDCNKILGQNVVRLCNLEEGIDLENLPALNHCINNWAIPMKTSSVSSPRNYLTRF